MPMNKRTESIRLKHLQDIYYEKLQGIAYDVYDEQLHNLIIRPEELDADIHLYFRQYFLRFFISVFLNSVTGYSLFPCFFEIFLLYWIKKLKRFVTVQYLHSYKPKCI